MITELLILKRMWMSWQLTQHLLRCFSQGAAVVDRTTDMVIIIIIDFPLCSAFKNKVYKELKPHWKKKLLKYPKIKSEF